MKNFFNSHKLDISVSFFFVIVMLIFIIAAPDVFLSYKIYTAVFSTLGLVAILTVTMVFLIVGGEIDLSFPSVIGVGAWLFALSYQNGISPYVALFIALAAGVSIGFFNGIMVTKIGLPSLVLTLAMNFLLRGLIFIGTEGNNVSVVPLRESVFRSLFVGNLAGVFPVQMIWAIAFCIFFYLFFYRHRFGGHVFFTGDNEFSAKEMGVKVDRVKIITFMMVGFSAAFVGILSTLLNNVFYATTGDGYLLIILAAVFLGGTPTWGGVGTIFGAFVGAFIISFIQTGIIASGLTGYYTQFFFGLILVIAILSHRFTGGSLKKLK